MIILVHGNDMEKIGTSIEKIDATLQGPSWLGLQEITDARYKHEVDGELQEWSDVPLIVGVYGRHLASWRHMKTELPDAKVLIGTPYANEDKEFSRAAAAWPFMSEQELELIDRESVSKLNEAKRSELDHDDEKDECNEPLEIDNLDTQMKALESEARTRLEHKE